jgi:hypothetical protein
MTDGKLFERFCGEERKSFEDELVLVVMNDRGVLKQKKNAKSSLTNLKVNNH